MKVCHPYCSRDRSLPRTGLNGEPHSPSRERHTLTFSWCPSSPIVLGCPLLPVTGVATPRPARQQVPTSWECMSQDRRTMAAKGHLVMFPFFRRLEPVVFLPHPQFWGAHHAVNSDPGRATQMGSVASSYEGRHRTWALSTQALELV